LPFISIVESFFILTSITAVLDNLWHNLIMSVDNKKISNKPKNQRVGNKPPKQQKPPKEIGGRNGLDPTRYGDWEKAGRCIDF
tara:strand:- start:9280 stop:9528 length:249 start_codon:yes stop_codon:yes gene_type:complete